MQALAPETWAIYSTPDLLKSGSTVHISIHYNALLNIKKVTWQEVI